MKAYISDCRTRNLTEIKIQSTMLLAILQEQQVVLLIVMLFPSVYLFNANMCGQ